MNIKTLKVTQDNVVTEPPKNIKVSGKIITSKC